MLQYLLRRLVTLFITLAGIMVVTFFISLVVPIDPLAAIAGPQAPQQTVERLRTLYGFDQPIYVQFSRYFQRLLQGDLGTSFQTGRPVLGLYGLAGIARIVRASNLRIMAGHITPMCLSSIIVRPSLDMGTIIRNSAIDIRHS